MRWRQLHVWNFQWRPEGGVTRRLSVSISYHTISYHIISHTAKNTKVEQKMKSWKPNEKTFLKKTRSPQRACGSISQIEKTTIKNIQLFPNYVPIILPFQNTWKQPTNRKISRANIHMYVYYVYNNWNIFVYVYIYIYLFIYIRSYHITSYHIMIEISMKARKWRPTAPQREHGSYYS